MNNTQVSKREIGSVMWPFWPEKEFSDVYENIYTRTFVKDWFHIIESIAKVLEGHKRILDIGCGEGHTTKQILDRVETEYVCDLLEPSKDALVSAEKFLRAENTIGTTHNTTLKAFHTKKMYDAVFTSHTNYYWSTEEKEYKEQLLKLTELAEDEGSIVILTLPADSDMYKVLLNKPYSAFVRSEYIEKFFRQLGYSVQTLNFPMRLFVGDFFSTKSLFDLKNFYMFLHGTDTPPSDEKSRTFLEKIEHVQKDGFLDFKDRLVIITKKHESLI